MIGKQFKYQEYLNKRENCPMKSCIERNVPAFRWVHSDITEDDFKPNIDHPKYPKRSLDESDLICESFALSVYKDLESSKDNYLNQYNARKNDFQKQKFIEQKGNAIALIHLTEEDGVSDEPNEKGHFSFFPYISFNCLERIKEVFSIFAV